MYVWTAIPSTQVSAVSGCVEIMSGPAQVVVGKLLCFPPSLSPA